MHQARAAAVAEQDGLAGNRDWLFTSQGDPRGYIQPQMLRELWFHTGTVCNLACPFCLEGSRPGDDRLNRILFNDAQPWIDEAVELGVEQFSFTGGEPLVIKDMVRILDYALRFNPCLVLTNATDPLLKRLQEVESLLGKPQPASFRVSLDYSDRKRHDAGRGEGNFDKALQGLGELHRRGFPVSVARQMEKGEDGEAVERGYRKVFVQAGLPEDLRIVSFPDFLTPGAQDRAEVAQITQDCMTRYQSAETRAAFMCNFSKMVIKKDGRMRVYACTLVDDDPDYDQGRSLRESLSERVMLKHHRCYSCFAFGSSCSEI